MQEFFETAGDKKWRVILLFVPPISFEIRLHFQVLVCVVLLKFLIKVSGMFQN